MKHLQNRPLATGCTAFLFSLWAVLSFFGGYGLLLAFVFLALLGLFMILTAKKPKILGLTIALLAPVVLACLTAHFRIDVPSSRVKEAFPDDTPRLVTAKCLEAGVSTAYYAEARVHIAELDADVILICEHDLDVKKGDVIEIGATYAETPPEHGFLPTYSPLPVLISTERDVTYRSLASPDFFEKTAKQLENIFISALDEEKAGLLCALLLGRRGGLPEDMNLVFENLGVSHILSVSGLHLTLLLFSLDLLLKKLTVPLRVRNGIALCGAIFFTLLVSCPPSMLRAAGMFLLARLASLVSRENDPVTTLSLSLTLISLVSPCSILDVALLLSGLATFGILLVTGRNALPKSLGNLPKRLIAASSVTIGALALTLPLTLASFGSFSLMTLPANLLLSLPVTLCMTAGMLCLLFGAIPFAGGMFVTLADLTSGLLLSLARALDGCNDYALAPSMGILIGAYLIAVLVFLLLIRRGNSPARRLLTMTLALTLVIGGGTIERALFAKNTEITYLSDDKEESILLSSAGASVLVDLSSGAQDAMTTAREELRGAHHRASLDALVLTHYHRRHVKQLTTVFRTMRVKALLLPLPVTATEREVADSILTLGEKWGAKVTFYQNGGEIAVGDAILRIRKTQIARSTHPVLTLEIETRGRRIAYLGASALKVDELSLSLARCDRILFGAHGPVIKEPMFPMGEVIFASEDVKAALGGEGEVLKDGVWRGRIRN